MPLSRKSTNQLILWLLVLTTAATLAVTLPDVDLVARHIDLFVIYALLTAVTLYFGVVLSEGELGAAHVFGMVALLSLPHAIHPVMLWSVAFGGVLGGLMLVARTGELLPHRPLTARTARSIVVITARVTLSFFVASQFYDAVGGRTPVQRLTMDEMPLLVAFSIVYLAVYFAIFLLETYTDGRSVGRLLRTNAIEILIVLALPIPFALLGAEVYSARLSNASFAILLAGITLMLFGQYSISRIQYRLRSQVEELRSLSAMSQTMSANLNLDTLVKMIYEQVSQLLCIDNFLVALYERGSKKLTYPFIVTNGVVEKNLTPQHTLRDGLLDHVLSTQSPLLISHDALEFARKMEAAAPAGTHSWLGVPLLAGGRLLGAMAVTSSDPTRRFGVEDLRLLNIVGANASIAIENAQLYEQQMARVDQLVTLNNILSLLTGTLSPDTVLDAVMSSAATLARADGVAVYLYWDDPTATRALVRTEGLGSGFAAASSDPLLLEQRRAQAGDPPPLVVPNVETHSRVETMKPALVKAGIQSLMELPLSIGSFGFGVLAFYYDEARSFSEEQIELYRAFANQAGQAIRNARLFSITDETLERRVGQLLALAAIGHELTATLDIQTICNLVLSHALDATGSTVGAVALTNLKTHSTPLIVERGYPAQTFNNPALLNAGVSGSVIKTGKPVMLSDVSANPDYISLRPGTRSQLSVPIQHGQTTLGFITLESDRPNAYNEEDSQFVTQLANQAVIAIDNAQLFQRIAEARDRLQVILDTMTEAIVLIDLDGRIALANPRVDLIGLAPETLLNHDLDSLLENPDLDLAEKWGFRSDQEVRKLVKEARAPQGWVGRDPASYELEVKGSTTYIQRRVFPVRALDGETIGIMLVFYDETEEHLLAQTRENLTNMIVHDLRSPLTAVRTSLNLLKAYIPPESEFRPLIETTTDASGRAIRKILARVDSLLDVARMESGHIKLETHPTELNPLVQNVALELSPLAQELEVTLITDIPDTLPLLALEADTIERVFLNLLDNALKFSPSSTAVKISAHSPDTGEARFIRVDVSDMGPGIPDDYKVRLFERYVQAGRGNRRGIGLGLTFCKLAVEAHGGRIWIEDNPQGGTVFALTLPIHQEEKVPEAG